MFVYTKRVAALRGVLRGRVKKRDMGPDMLTKNKKLYDQA